MIDYSKAIMKQKIENVSKALEENNIKGYHISSREELFEVLETLVPDGAKVGYGGSMTLTDAGVIDWLRWKKNIELYDRARVDDQDECMRKSLVSDVFFTSTNAITEDGWLYNVDGRGNRVSAMIFGPKSVVVIAGWNKIVADLAAAQTRVRKVAAPANCMRLDKQTPCTKTTSCVNCKSPDRICRSFVALGPQGEKNRIKVLILEENLGY